MLKVLLLCLLLLDLICVQSIDLGYLLILPSILYYSTYEKVYVHVLTPDSDRELAVKMVTKAANITLTTQKYSSMESQHSVTFSVPASTEEQEVATIEVWATGNGIDELMESKKVVIKKPEVGIVIQTDRPIFQPGQEVRCRVAQLNRNLIAVDKVFKRIELLDPEGNKIARWSNVYPQNGIADLSYTLPDVLTLGEYKFTVMGDQEVSVPFAVKKYVLPKFQLKVSAPGSIPITQKPFDITMCGTYTYGKSVQGELIGKTCHRASPGSGKTDICKPIIGKTDTRGCHTARIDTDSLELKSYGYEFYLDVEVSLMEGGTGVKMEEKKSIRITYTLAVVDFLDKNPSYRKGIQYKGKMLLSTDDGSPMPNEELSLYINGVLQNDVYRTDERGVATFSLDTNSWTNAYVDLRGEYNPPEPVASTVEVQPHYQPGYTTVKLFYSELRSQVQIRRDPSSLLCGDKAQLWAEFILDPLEFDGQTSVVFYALVVSQGRVKRDSRISHELTQKSDLKGFISVPITFDDDLAPVATLILYFVLPGGGLVADGAEFEISDNCYPNKVSVKLSEKQTLPASELHLNIRAAPGSLCSCRSIDRSILLLREDTHNAESQVNSFLLRLAQRGYPQEAQELQSCFSSQPFPVPMEERLVRAKRPLMPLYIYEIDIFSIFQGCGMKIMSSERYRKPEECHDLQPFMVNDEIFQFSAVGRPTAELAEISNIVTAESTPAEPAPQIRKDFAETWLFELYAVGPSGQTTIAVTAPDTITQYVVDTLCTSPVGIGFSLQETLDIFKPFFVEVITPYSVKRGESFILKAIIFSHLKQCIKVEASLFKSLDFTLQECADCSYQSCLCDNPTFTAVWIIVPNKIGIIELIVSTKVLTTSDLCDGKKTVVPQKGRSDTVLKHLKVEAEGMKVEKTHSSLLCPLESDTVSLVVPANVVKGSQSAVITLIGDAMGTCLANQGDLLQMPYGCGEQNMMNFAINIALINYILATEQMTDEILTKAKYYQQSGFVRQLTYKRFDGSYSAFGNSDPSGNTWLTAYVALWFYLCNNTIFIEYIQITDALDWLKNLQQDDGCFTNVGKLFHNDLKGGVNNQLSLAAYITAAFLQINDPKYESVIKKALVCLEKCLDPETSVYTKALCFYVSTLAKYDTMMQKLQDQLEGLTRTSGNGIYWSDEPVVPDDDPTWSNPQSGAVETTAYILNALVSKPNPSSAELATCFQISRWLISQQNAQGAFSSTQDTVVAFQGLSRFWLLTFKKDSSFVATITNTKGFSYSFVVNNDNRLILQQKKLPDIPEKYSISVYGTGCAFIQLILRYNVPEPKTEGTFSLNARTTAINCPPHPLPSIALTIVVSYIGNREASNMAMLEVNLLSGYGADANSVNNLLTNNVVKKTEVHESSVNIYLDELTSAPVTMSFQLEQRCPVMNLQPALMKLYDYYRTQDRVEGSYNTPCK